MKILLTAVFILTAACACAEDKIFLYGDYYAGMSEAAFFKTGEAQCDRYPPDDMVCNRQKISFAGLQWTQFFEFKGGKLTAVGFGRPMSLEVFEMMFVWFMNDDYSPVEIAGDNFSLNLATMDKPGKREEDRRDIEKFNNLLPSSESMRAYLMKNSDLKNFAAEEKGVNPRGVVASIGGSKAQGNMFVIFELAEAAFAKK